MTELTQGRRLGPGSVFDVELVETGELDVLAWDGGRIVLIAGRMRLLVVR